MDYQLEVNARNLNCPLPILRCKKGLSEVADGEIVKVIATDPGSVADFKAFCKQTENELVDFSDINDEFTFYIRKRASNSK